MRHLLESRGGKAKDVIEQTWIDSVGWHDLKDVLVQYPSLSTPTMRTK